MTNHRFGADVIESAIINCGTSAVILVASQDWTRVVAIRLENGHVVSTDYGAYAGPESFADLPDCN